MWLSWLDHCPIDQKVAGLIPGQGTCQGCGFCPQLGRIWKAASQYLSLMLMFLSPTPKAMKKMSLGKDLKTKNPLPLTRAPQCTSSPGVRFAWSLLSSVNVDCHPAGPVRRVHANRMSWQHHRSMFLWKQRLWIPGLDSCLGPSVGCVASTNK